MSTEPRIEKIIVGCNADALKGGINYCDDCPYTISENNCLFKTGDAKPIIEEECNHIGVCISGRHEQGCQDCCVWQEYDDNNSEEEEADDAFMYTWMYRCPTFHG